jgi:hypothetical protein
VPFFFQAQTAEKSLIYIALENGSGEITGQLFNLFDNRIKQK